MCYGVSQQLLPRVRVPIQQEAAKVRLQPCMHRGAAQWQHRKLGDRLPELR